MKYSYNQVLKLSLILFALHSFMIGVGLLFAPKYLLASFGFNIGAEVFYPMQGGVFHILMAIAYYMASTDVIKHLVLVRFAIIVKFSATVFLLGYFGFFSQIAMVLFSGIVDLLMALVLLFLYSKVKLSKELEK